MTRAPGTFYSRRISPASANNRQTPPSGRPNLTRLEREKLLRLGIEAALEDLDLRSLLSKVVEHACRLLGAEDGGVGLLATDPPRFVVAAVHNLPESELGSEWEPGHGLAGLILSSGRPMIVNRYGDIDPKKRPELAENAVVGVPITRRKRLVGFFGIGARAPRKFTQADVRILSQFARACGVVIENARLFESTQESLRRTQLLYSTATTLSQASLLDDVVAAYLAHIAASLKVNCNVVVYERGHDGEIAWNVSRGRILADRTMDMTAVRVRHDRDALDDLLDKGENLLFTDVRKDPRVPPALRAMQATEGNPSLALVPLVSRNRRVGLVTLSRPRAHEWTQDEIQPFVVTAAHLAAAIDIRQEQELLAEERQHLALVEERRRLARDLHDSVTQSLFAMQLLAQAIVSETTEAGTEKARRLADLCRNSLREMRALLSELRPIEDAAPKLATRPHSLRDRLLQHANEMAMTAKVNVLDDSFLASSGEVEHALFRIAQEALTNAHKHSGAHVVDVVLTSVDGVHAVEVHDQGDGFELSSGAQGRFGLVGMRERAESLGGRLTLYAEPGKGVKIRAEIPETDP